MPSLRRSAFAITGALAGVAVGAALAIPPARRQVARASMALLDTVALRLPANWSGPVVILTSEGRRSGLPRTVLLHAVRMDGALHVLSWSTGAGWLANIEDHPDVVVDDRSRVYRARASAVTGEQAARVRAEYLAQALPAFLRDRLPGHEAVIPATAPVVRLQPR
ncbi:MAG: nitroreductase family deazaflavin-dependent oxidoreductase [Candidatus Dormibacteria bacterium]